MTYTVNRIAKLLAYTGLPELQKDQLITTGAESTPGHAILDQLDTLLGVDTRTLGALECNCLWHIGKVCSSVRQLGARVILLEEAVARDRCQQEVNRKLEEYNYG
jgi:hypothetical protein